MKIKAFQFKAGRHNSDPERRILPTIVYVNTNHKAFDDLRTPGFVIAFYWWNFYVKFYLLLTK